MGLTDNLDFRVAFSSFVNILDCSHTKIVFRSLLTMFPRSIPYLVTLQTDFTIKASLALTLCISLSVFDISNPQCNCSASATKFREEPLEFKFWSVPHRALSAHSAIAGASSNVAAANFKFYTLIVYLYTFQSFSSFVSSILFETVSKTSLNWTRFFDIKKVCYSLKRISPAYVNA